MTTFDKVRIWLGVMLYGVAQTFMFCVAAALACETPNPLEWNDTIQFLIMGISVFILHRLFLLTKQKIAQLEELMDTKEEISGKLDELLDRIMRNGGKKPE